MKRAILAAVLVAFLVAPAAVADDEAKEKLARLRAELGELEKKLQAAEKAGREEAARELRATLDRLREKVRDIENAGREGAGEDGRTRLRLAMADVDKARRELQMEMEMIAAEEARAADELSKELAEKIAGVEKRIEETRNRIQALQTRAVAPEAFEGERRELEAEIALLERQKAEMLAEADAGRAAATGELASRKEEIARKMEELAVRERRIRAAAESPDGREAPRGRERTAGGKRITANFKDTPLADCLAFLAEQGGVNFVHAGSLEGETVTAVLSDVPAVEAAWAVLRAAGYKAEPAGDDVLVIRGRDELAGLEAERDRLELEIEILELEARRAQLEKELEEGR